MAERRFAALAELKKRPRVDPPEAFVPETVEAPPPVVHIQPIMPPSPLPAAPMPAQTAVGQGRGRPPGKRSDPEWKPRTILMRTKIHRRVSGILLEQDEGPDLSELIDELLAGWISKQP